MMPKQLLTACVMIAGCQDNLGTPVAKLDDKGGEALLFEAQPDQLKHLQIITVAHRKVVRPLVAPAVVAFDDLKTSEVTPLVGGKVAKILVREGDKVIVGQPLMVIASPDSSDNATNLLRDRAALVTKKAVLARDTDLYAHKAISLEELQAAQLDVESTQASVANDEAHISITGSNTGGAVLHSPIAGVVVGRTVSVGQSVQAGTTTSFTITDPTAVWVMLQLYQEDLRRVAIGDASVIRSPVLDAPLDGKVTYIGASIDPDTLTIPVRVAVPNPGAILKKGMYVNAAIMPAKQDDLVVVPLDSVLRDADNLPFVYIEASPGKFARRHIELGDQLADGYTVKGGLKDGEQVLGTGAIFVQFADTLGPRP
jgi:cobalt-zinc-cadmium efflux system membrane fusion protein